MSDRPKQNRWQNWQLGDRLPGRSSNFEVMLQAKEAGDLRLPGHCHAPRPRVGPHPSVGSILHSVVKKGGPHWLLRVVRSNGQERDGELHNASQGLEVSVLLLLTNQGSFCVT